MVDKVAMMLPPSDDWLNVFLEDRFEVASEKRT